MVGRVLGHYSILDEIAHGGMSVVYRAKDRKLNRIVALKVVPEHLLRSPKVREAFRTEARALSRLNHPNVETVFDADTVEGIEFLVTEYIPGRTLAEALAAGRLDEGDQIDVATQIARALDYVHRRGVVHGDVTPGNVVITPEGHVKLVDFGLARLLPEVVTTDALDEPMDVDTLRGTLPYMAPEQILGAAVDVRTDIYSLGVVLHEMATGSRPFTGTLMTALMTQIIQGQDGLLRGRLSAVSSRMRRVIEGCMARRPDDRFASAADVASALEAIRVPRPRPAWRHAAPVALLAAIGYAGVATTMGWWPYVTAHGSGESAAPGEWMLVAEFDGASNELTSTLRALVVAALDQSGFVAVVPPEQVRVGLEMAGKPLDTRVDAEVAKDLAFRGAVRSVLEGSIGRLGHGYAIVLRVVDAESTKVVLTESITAKDDDELIPSVERLVVDLLKGLGEKRASITALRRARRASTPSLDAYRLLVLAGRVKDQSVYDAIPLYRQALHEDPDFALAWRDLASAYRDAGELDSARTAIDEALRRPQRLTPLQVLETEALRHLIDEDPARALAAFDQVRRLDPSGRAGRGGRLVALYALGRYEEVVEESRAIERPFGMSQTSLQNEIGNLLRLGRVEEAREFLPRIAGVGAAMRMRVSVELVAGNWAAVEAALDTAAATPGLPPRARIDILGTLAPTLAARGAFRQADATFRSAESFAEGGVSGRLLNAQLLARGRLALSIVSEGAVPVPAANGRDDTSAAEWITRGLQAAVRGDAARARRMLSAARRVPDAHWPLQGASPVTLEARIALLEGRAGEAVTLLRPVAAQRREIGDEVHFRIGLSLVRWTLADAFEALGQTDSAATVLERVVTDPGPWLEELHTRGIMLPFAHRRLALLYSRMGRVEDAERHWSMFRETMRTPDPEIVPLIEEARSAVESARALAASGLP